MYHAFIHARLENGKNIFSFIGPIPKELCDMKDPLYPVPLKFDNLEDAVKCCKENNVQYEVSGAK